MRRDINVGISVKMLIKSERKLVLWQSALQEGRGPNSLCTNQFNHPSRLKRSLLPKHAIQLKVVNVHVCYINTAFVARALINGCIGI